MRGIQEELRVTDQLLESCRETLALIPECPTHGFCHPHMQAWIKARLPEGSFPEPRNEVYTA